MADALSLPAASIGDSIQGGIKNGREWAVMAQQVAQRRATLDRQYQTLKAQEAQHKIKVMEKSVQAWGFISQADPRQRGNLIKFQEAQDAMMGIDSQGMAMMAKDPKFSIDVVGPIQKLLGGIKSTDPAAVSQAFASYQAITKDPIGGRQLLNNLVSRFAQADQNAQKNSQAETKRVSGDLKQYQLKLQSDQNYRKAQAKVTGADGVLKDLDLAKTNPTAANAAGINLANLATGYQRITNVEIHGLGKGSEAIIDRLKQFAAKGLSGTLTDSNIASMKEFARTLGENAKQDLHVVGLNYAKAYSQLSGLSVPDSFKKLTGNDYIDAPEKEEKKGAGLSKDQIEMIKTGIGQHKDKYSQEEIRGAIEQNLGRPLNDDELGQVGLKSSAPTPLMAAPAQPSAQAPAQPLGGEGFAPIANEAPMANQNQNDANQEDVLQETPEEGP